MNTERETQDADFRARVGLDPILAADTLVALDWNGLLKSGPGQFVPPMLQPRESFEPHVRRLIEAVHMQILPPDTAYAAINAMYKAQLQ